MNPAFHSRPIPTMAAITSFSLSLWRALFPGFSRAEAAYASHNINDLQHTFTTLHSSLSWRTAQLLARTSQSSLPPPSNLPSTLAGLLPSALASLRAQPTLKIPFHSEERASQVAQASIRLLIDMEERLGRFVAEMKPTREFLRLFLEGDRAAFQRLLSHPCVLGEGGKELERFAEVVRMWQVPEVEVAGVREMEQLGIRAERLVEEAERIFRNEVAIPERGEEGMIPEGVRFGVVRKRMCSGSEDE